MIICVLVCNTSVNNVRGHINDIITRDNWKRRERYQTLPYKIDDKTITINIAFTLDRDKFELTRELVHQAEQVLGRVMYKHFDGQGRGFYGRSIIPFFTQQAA